MTGTVVAGELIQAAKSISASIVRGSEVTHGTLVLLHSLQHAAGI